MTMGRILDKEQILHESSAVFRQMTDYCITIPNDVFFKEAGEKWSIAQNLAHLIISQKTTVAAYALPKFLVRLIGGKPNRPSRSYEELVEKYSAKLSAGGKAQGRYVPKKIHPSHTRDQMLNRWLKVTEEYLEAIRKNWTNEQFDQYIVKHPLLGKITLRELCYFTIYHTRHHLGIIKSRSPHIAN
jgi:hypothetical protein